MERLADLQWSYQVSASKMKTLKIFFKWHFMIVEGLCGVESASLPDWLRYELCIPVFRCPPRPPAPSSFSAPQIRSLPPYSSAFIHVLLTVQPC